MAERRKAPRVSIREVGLASKIKHLLMAALKTPGSGRWDPVVNLSVTGACFLSDEDLSPDQRLLLTLRIDDHLPPIEFEGTTVRVDPREHAGCYRRVAVRFTEYKGNALSMLQWFQQQYATPPRSPGQPATSPN